MKPPLLLQGMHGLGDNLHQRALIRQLTARHRVFLESSWIAPYHDLVGDDLVVLRKESNLRTQNKNADREAALFASERPPASARRMRVWYEPTEVRRRGSVLAAMCAATGCDYATADFRLPVPPAGRAAAQDLLAEWRPTKPILIYRPLVERTEWNGCAARNPDHAAYAALFDSIRDDFFVVSLADLVPGVEWMVGLACEADVRLHRGELPFETLAALVSMAALVFATPGFAVILAQAVGTPVICVFGGYERAYSFSAGARYSSYLGIEPINPTDAFTHDLRHDKSIDLARARSELALFAGSARERGDRAAPLRPDRAACAIPASG